MTTTPQPRQPAEDADLVDVYASEHFTTEDDVEVDTITPARMEHLRRLADQFASART